MDTILLLAAAVSVNTETIPTYTWGGFEKNSIFYFGRIYQGAQGRVYPYLSHVWARRFALETKGE